MKHFRQHPAWQFIDPDLDRLPDPRVSLGLFLAWIPSKNDHRQTNGIEPDNYNFCIFDHKPHDLKFIENSVFYRSEHKEIPGWFSLYMINELACLSQFNLELLNIQPRAVWRYQNAHPVRPLKTLLPKQGNPKIRNPSLTVEERLWQQGYYEKLQSKYFDGDEKIINVIGEPRGFVLEVQPEVEFQTD